MSKTSLIVKARKAVRASDDHVQVIRDLAGAPAFAVMPWSDYERLTAGEDALLIAAGEVARHDEAFPEDVARRLIAGEPPLRVVREWREMSQNEVAKKSGVAGQYISQIERGTRKAGRDAAKRLSNVLGVSTEMLMDI